MPSSSAVMSAASLLSSTMSIRLGKLVWSMIVNEKVSVRLGPGRGMVGAAFGGAQGVALFCFPDVNYS
ncbi:hypothetical protein ACEN9F_13050 [Duganella sp. CT11-25]|uniref:hypothetical protein n=1 Tax=unclassified Duganella TaxID=2636909 RepID=UPI0039B0368C